MKETQESLWSYIDQFTQLSVEVEGTEESLKCWIFQNGLLCDHPFYTKVKKEKGENYLRDVKPNTTIHLAGGEIEHPF